MALPDKYWEHRKEAEGILSAVDDDKQWPIAQTEDFDRFIRTLPIVIAQAQAHIAMAREIREEHNASR